MTEQATIPEITTTVKNRPYLMAETPVDDGCDTVEVWVRQGDELATMRHTQAETDEDDDGNEIEKETELMVFMRGDEVFELAMAGGKALAALGDRANLVALIQGLVDELGEMS